MFVGRARSGQCQKDWENGHKWHIDMWIGPDTATPADKLYPCEDKLTTDHALVEFDPPSHYNVDEQPLFDGKTLKCIV